jgi:isoleucyl-tRNA synthetase
MLIRLAVAVKEVDDNMDAYDLTRASRVFADYFDDLSNWFIRRSRARFQNPESEEDNVNATNTLAYILVETSKMLAPFAPFASEYVYQEFKKMGYGDLKESVHLDDFPKTKVISEEDKKVLEQMAEVRKIVTIALEERMKTGIKVKQPLSVFETTSKVDEEFLQVAYGEINVKKILGGQQENRLDTAITEELKKEGMVRELVRNIQDLRKQINLTPQQKVELVVSTDEPGKKLISEFEEEIKKTTKLTGIKFGEAEGEEVKVGEMVFKFKIEK